MLNPSANFFFSDYFTACQSFCDLAKTLGWAQESLMVEPNLFIDVLISAYLPNRPTILVSSGLHGVKAFLAPQYNWHC
jgi:hypothetical protein